MSAATGISVPTLSKIESNADAAPKADTLRAAAVGFGCTVDELVGLARNPPPALLELVQQGIARPAPTAAELAQLCRARVVLGRDPTASDYLALLMLIRSH